MYYNLSLAQGEMYKREIYFRETGINNISMSISFDKDITYEEINECINSAIKTTSNARWQVCIDDDGAIKQYLQEYSEHTFPIVEFDTVKEYQEWADKKVGESAFNYDTLLYKFYIADIKETKNWYIFVNINHILMDAMGASCFLFILINRIEYKLGNTDSLLLDKNDYRMFLESEQKYLKSKAFTSDTGYWKERIEEYDGKTLPYVQESENYEGQRYENAISAEFSQKIFGFCKEYKISPSCFMNAVYAFYKSRITSSNSTSIQIALHNRNKKETAAVGMFVKTLPLIINIDDESSVFDYLSYFKRSEMKFLKHHRYTYGLIQDNFELKEGILDFGISYQTLSFVDLEEKGYHLTWLRNGHKDNITVSVSERYGGNQLLFEYDYPKHRYKKEIIEHFHESILKIISEFINSPQGKIKDINIIGDTEKDLILNKFNNTNTEYPKEKTVVELFEEQVKKYPDNISVALNKEKLTYAELNAKANGLAYKLREIGVKPNDFVAIIADRGIETVIGIYGIIKAGGAYVPIDPTYPEERINFMLEDCKPKVVLKNTSKSVNISDSITVLDLKNKHFTEEIAENPKCINKPDDLLYCIYTSGTTGNPKGVAVEHHGVVNLKYFFQNKMGINKNDNILQFANFIFDASVWEMTMALLNAAKLVLLPDGLAQSPVEFSEYCSEQNVTVATLPPNYFVQDDVKINLRLLITAGSESNNVVLKKSESCQYINAYGPTETTICSNFWIRPDNWTERSTPIGRPIDNFRSYVMNGDRLCTIGVPGELCIAGEGIARGYLNRPELTAEKFVKNPFGEGRMYRSGDLVRWLPNGNIEYLGRIDDQVKIRGFRIELGEIESRILEIENIKDCAVIAKADENGDMALYAYYVSSIEVEISDIRNRLSENLPVYMIPAYFMQIDKIPVTRNGKLDKNALPVIEAKTSREYIAPRNEKEQTICDVFRKILNVERVGINDNYFELGGDSIKAIKIVSELRSKGFSCKATDIMKLKNLKNIIFSIENNENIQKYEQKEVTGVVSKTQIIKEFEKWNLKKPSHFNQAMLFHVEGSENEIIHNAINELVKHHDMLRCVYRNGELRILSVNESKLCSFYEYDLTNEADKANTMEAKCNEIQESIDLENGPVVKAAVFELGEEKMLLLCIHHLVVDGISWRILKEDFDKAVTALKESCSVEFGEKTVSFIQWSKKITGINENDTILETDRKYWSEIVEKIRSCNTGLIADSSLYKGGTLRFEFPENVSIELFGDVNKAYNTNNIDILLASLTETIYKWKSERKILVAMEGHGRSDNLTNMSSDRTVGWFTCTYPMVFDYFDETENTLINVKEAIRQIPNNGTSYGILYKDSEIEPEMYFNYLGELNESDFSNYSYGKSISDDNRLPGKINFNLLFNDGKLIGEISFNQECISFDEIDSLKEIYETSLQNIIKFCLNSDEDIKTLSDLDEEIDNDELSLINDFFDLD